MADDASKRHGYHELTDDRWVMGVSAEAVQEMLLHAASAVHPHGDRPARLTQGQYNILENNMNFLGRAMRGFVVEFLRQSAQGITNINFDSQSDDEEIARRAAPGLFHARACVDGLVRRGMDVNSACYAMGLCVRHAIDTFTERYNEREELLERGDALASVLYRAGAIRDELKKIAQTGKNSAKTPGT